MGLVEKVNSANHLDYTFSIIGLEFQKNTFLINNEKGPVGVSKLASSEGPLISDFVTHQAHFAYDTYGIHVGQDDRLTFFGGHGQTILGHFVDCRKDSETLGAQLTVEYNPSYKRRLVIPRGVAHTFDHLDFIVTRDEPVWYTDFHNPDWDINNDLISIPRALEGYEIPKIKVNPYKLPFEGHVLFSKIQQELLQQPKRYAKREKIEESDFSSYQLTENESWKDKRNEYEYLIGMNSGIDGLVFEKNSYALTGSKSYTIVPSTNSCLSDVIAIDFRYTNPYFWVHFRQSTIVTILDREKSSLKMDFCDLRKDVSFRTTQTVHFLCDPRVRIRIPAGVCYCFNGEGLYHIRYEMELLVHEKDPREDIPLFGQDLTKFDANDVMKTPKVEVPSIKCPDSVLWLLAREEINTVNELNL